MELTWDDRYPTGAEGGADFFTRAAQGDLRIDGADGPTFRKERVLLTSTYLDYGGQVCVGERTVRHLAHTLKMVDGWRVERIADDNVALRKELVELSARVADQARQIEFHRQLEAQPASVVFVALDGTRHASERGAMEATAAMLDVTTAMIQNAKPQPLDPPLEAEEVPAS